MGWGFNIIFGYKRKMTYHDYIWGREISAKKYPFYALIQTAMRQVDTNNLDKLKSLFPGTFKELQTRYNSPKDYCLMR